MIERTDLHVFAYELAFKEFSDLWDAWKVLETKAQATLATVGIFEAGAFAYLTQAAPTAGYAKHLLFAMVIALGISLLLCAFSIRVRHTAAPFKIGVPGHILADAIGPGPFEKRYEYWTGHATEVCLDANAKIRSALHKKALFLSASLWSLLIASVIAIGVVGGSLYIEAFKKTADAGFLVVQGA